jgi:serine phosphatase RsbU (regulator of sigma subunit)
VPLLLDDQAVGTLALVWAQEIDFGEDSRQLLGALARYTAQAVDRARLLAERREVARTLQAALLPDLPPVPWLPMSGFYRPAGTADLVGGDWYDAFVSVPGDGERSETVTVVVGDVTGHDTYAAAEMGRLQAKLRALAIDHPDEPDELMRRLDRVMLANVHNRLATAIVANVTTRPDGTVTFSWCSAGHPPPLLIEPGDAEARYLSRPADPLLGLEAGLRRHRHSVVLPPGSTVLLYTDGLIERRDRDLDDGLQALLRSASSQRTDGLEALVRALAEDLLTTEPDDDTVIFALRTMH